MVARRLLVAHNASTNSPVMAALGE